MLLFSLWGLIAFASANDNVYVIAFNLWYILFSEFVFSSDFNCLEAFGN